jgi:hypothetical protein
VVVGKTTTTVERVAETNRGGGLALARRRRIDRRDQDQLAVGLVGERILDEIHTDLGLVMTVRFELFGRNAELFARDVEDRPHLGGLRDFPIGFRLIGHDVHLSFNLEGAPRRHRRSAPATRQPQIRPRFSWADLWANIARRAFISPASPPL